MDIGGGRGGAWIEAPSEEEQTSAGERKEKRREREERAEIRRDPGR